ncbi:MAG TPA: extracellular solute-binding protein [Gammaproteobacteria bacterium]|nr:extracellular solute-binding protein [Gammaproteobacteria bacterium]
MAGQRVLSGSVTAQSLNRRAFLRLAGLATGMAMLGGIRPVAMGQAPARLQGTRLRILQGVNFVPAHDEVLKKQLAAWEKQSGAKVAFETINMNDIQARTTVAIENKSGPDIIGMIHNWPHLYETGLEAVDDLAEELGHKGEGYYDLAKAHNFVNGHWRAVPSGFVSPASTYRTDWFKEIGYDTFPDTWQEYREAGKKLKAKGHPIGQAFGHSLGDPNIFCYALLWAFGGKEVEADGKTVALDSKETLEAVEFGVGFWKDACDEGGLAWDDSSNNRAFLAEQISATFNGASIWVEAKRNFPHVMKVMNHAYFPAGPHGRYHPHVSLEYAILTYSPNKEAAKELIGYLMEYQNYAEWLRAGQGFSTAPTKVFAKDKMWSEVDPQVEPFKDIAKYGRQFGYAGPASRKAAEVAAKYIIVDMYAKAIQGTPPKEAIKWATAEVEKVYKA